jgi:hypothetical protein
MAPGCKLGARKRYAGSNPALPNSLRALHSGNALAFQARVAGSIPAARSNKTQSDLSPYSVSTGIAPFAEPRSRLFRLLRSIAPKGTRRDYPSHLACHIMP